MPHVIQQKLPVLFTQPNNVPIHRVPAGSDNIVFLIEYSKGFVAAVDGPNAVAALDYCHKNALEITHILNTHTHHDHIGINKDLDKKGLLEAITVVGSSKAPTPIPGLSTTVGDGDTFFLGERKITTMETEGHINGHVSFVIDDFVFCGDTLFTGGCGYLFDGPPQKMHHSLQRLSELPENTKVCCAHEYTLDNLWFAFSVEPDNDDLLRRIVDAQTVLADGGTLVPSTIGLERRTNPFLRVDSPTIQKQIKSINGSTNLNDGAAVFAEIRELKNQKQYRKIKLPTSI